MVPSPEAVWRNIGSEAEAAAVREPDLREYLERTVSRHATLASALAGILAAKIAGDDSALAGLKPAFAEVLGLADVADSAAADLHAIVTRDPACLGYLSAFSDYKGILALSGYRVAHQLWREDRKTTARLIQSRISELWCVDIHPAAKIGKGIFIDHGTGLVIGETAVVEDGVSLLHGVTLGGTGKGHADRHPKVRHGVLIGTGATILGNIEIGSCARIGAGSVVLQAVPANRTAVGVPARILSQPAGLEPALAMDHSNWII